MKSIFGLSALLTAIFAGNSAAPAAFASPVPLSQDQQDDQDQQKTGRELLDAALEAKLSARGLTDLGNVIDLCEQALEAELSDGDKDFCKNLLASTLLERANGLANDAILARPPTTLEDLRQLSQFREIAIKDLKRSVEVVPDVAEAHYRLGRLLAMDQASVAEALRAFNSALELDFEDDTMKAQAYVARAAVSDDAAQQLADYNAAVELLPENTNVLELRAKHYIDEGDYAEGLTAIEASIKIGESPRAHELRGQALLNLDRIDDALAAYDRSLELNPQAPLTLLQRANIHIMLEHGARAVDDINQTINMIQQSPPRLLAMRATAHLQNSQKSEAIKDIHTALEQMENEEDADSVTLLRLGFVLLQAEESREAIDVFSKVLEIEAENTMAMEARADSYLNVGNHSSAIADYNKALELDPESDHSLNNLAWVLATSPDDEVRDGKRAVELATKAAELTEFKEAHILSTLAAGYAEVGDFESAMEWSTKSVEAADDEARADLEAELESYKQGKPWRERQTEGDGAKADDGQR